MTAYEVFRYLFIDLRMITMPLLSLIVVVAFKAISMPGEINATKAKELLHFGVGLTNSGLMLIISNTCIQIQQAISQSPAQATEALNVQLTMLLVYILLNIIFLWHLRGFGWGEGGTMKPLWIFISDVYGVAMLLFAVWLMG